MTRLRLGWMVVVAGLLAAPPAAAQQRPLVTEDPEVIGAGLVLLEGGFDYSYDVLFPASGLQGNLLRVPTLGLSFGDQLDRGAADRRRHLQPARRSRIPVSGLRSAGRSTRLHRRHHA